MMDNAIILIGLMSMGVILVGLAALVSMEIDDD